MDEQFKQQIADEANRFDPPLKAEQVTKHWNTKMDYPQNTGSIFIWGFDNFADVTNFAEKFNAQKAIATKREGHTFVHIYSTTVFRPYDVDDYIEALGDDYRKATPEDYYPDMERLKEAETFSELKQLVDNVQEIRDEAENADDDEEIILCNGKYFATVPVNMLSFRDDVTTRMIGVYFDHEKFISDD